MGDENKNLKIEVVAGDGEVLEGYKIRVNGIESEQVDYGDPVEVEVDGVTYTGFVDVDERGDLITPFEDFVFIAQRTGVECGVVEDEDGEEETPAPVADVDVE